MPSATSEPNAMSSPNAQSMPPSRDICWRLASSGASLGCGVKPSGGVLNASPMRWTSSTGIAVECSVSGCASSCAWALGTSRPERCFSSEPAFVASRTSVKTRSSWSQ